MNVPQTVDIGHGELRVDLHKAVAACVDLVMAYRSGRINGGSIDWSDVDTAYASALDALGVRQEAEDELAESIKDAEDNEQP